MNIDFFDFLGSLSAPFWPRLGPLGSIWAPRGVILEPRGPFWRPFLMIFHGFLIGYFGIDFLRFFNKFLCFFCLNKKIKEKCRKARESNPVLLETQICKQRFSIDFQSYPKYARNNHSFTKVYCQADLFLQANKQTNKQT